MYVYITSLSYVPFLRFQKLRLDEGLYEESRPSSDTPVHRKSTLVQWEREGL